jgi:hypothetical protein
MFSRLIDWTAKLVFRAVAKRVAEQAGDWMGEEVEPLDVEEVKALPSPKRK